MIERLRELDQKARPGPWFRQGFIITGPDQDGLDIGLVGMTSLEPDAALIAESRNALPALLAVAKAGQRVVALWGHDALSHADGMPELRQALSQLEAIAQADK